MREAGLFEDKRVELIEGNLFEYGRKTPRYCAAVALVSDALRKRISKSDVFFVTEQFPLEPSDLSLLWPDVMLLVGAPRDYTFRAPTLAELVVEVAGDSLTFDRNEKVSLYAKAGIADYWIVNLQDRQIEVHRRPIADANAEFGFSYGDKMIFKEGDSVKPLAKPKVSIAVADLLP